MKLDRKMLSRSTSNALWPVLGNQFLHSYSTQKDARTENKTGFWCHSAGHPSCSKYRGCGTSHTKCLPCKKGQTVHLELTTEHRILGVTHWPFSIKIILAASEVRPVTKESLSHSALQLLGYPVLSLSQYVSVPFWISSKETLGTSKWKKKLRYQLSAVSGSCQMQKVAVDLPCFSTSLGPHVWILPSWFISAVLYWPITFHLDINDSCDY